MWCSRAYGRSILFSITERNSNGSPVKKRNKAQINDNRRRYPDCYSYAGSFRYRSMYRCHIILIIINLPDIKRIRCQGDFFEIRYRNPAGFRRWVKVAKSENRCYTYIMGTWKSKNRKKSFA